MHKRRGDCDMIGCPICSRELKESLKRNLFAQKKEGPMRDLEYFERRLLETLAELEAMTKERDELKAKVKELELEQVMHIEILNNLWSEKLTAWRKQCEKLFGALSECQGHFLSIKLDYAAELGNTPKMISECALSSIAEEFASHSAFKKERGEG